MSQSRINIGFGKMGVDLAVYRARIGLYCSVGQKRSVSVGHRTKQVLISHTAVAFLFVSLALLLCGDIESNPGPGPRKERQCVACYAKELETPNTRFFSFPMNRFVHHICLVP